MNNLEKRAAKIKALFPLKFKVTNKIIEWSNREDIHNCIGANSLKEALGITERNTTVKISWGRTDGNVELKSKDGKSSITLYVSNKDKVDMMKIEKPRTVTFNFISEEEEEYTQ